MSLKLNKKFLEYIPVKSKLFFLIFEPNLFEINTICELAWFGLIGFKFSPSQY